MGGSTEAVFVVLAGNGGGTGVKASNGTMALSATSCCVLVMLFKGPTRIPLSNSVRLGFKYSAASAALNSLSVQRCCTSTLRFFFLLLLRVGVLKRLIGGSGSTSSTSGAVSMTGDSPDNCPSKSLSLPHKLVSLDKDIQRNLSETPRVLVHRRERGLEQPKTEYLLLTSLSCLHSSHL